MSRVRAAVAPLRHRRYVRLLVAGLVSSTGTAMATGAVAYVVLQAGAGPAGVTGAGVLFRPCAIPLLVGS